MSSFTGLLHFFQNILSGVVDQYDPELNVRANDLRLEILRVHIYKFILITCIYKFIIYYLYIDRYSYLYIYMLQEMDY